MRGRDPDRDVFGHYDRPHTLYRAYDDAGDLLYVGITSMRPRVRLLQHRRKSAWWADVDRITFEDHADKGAAVRAELEAIELEAPAHNVMRFAR